MLLSLPHRCVLPCSGEVSRACSQCCRGAHRAAVARQSAIQRRTAMWSSIATVTAACPARQAGRNFKRPKQARRCSAHRGIQHPEIGRQAALCWLAGRQAHLERLILGQHIKLPPMQLDAASRKLCTPRVPHCRQAGRQGGRQQGKSKSASLPQPAGQRRARHAPAAAATAAIGKQ